MARFLTPARLVAAGLVLLAAVAVLYFAPSDKYIFLPDKARAVAPLVDVQGERPDPNGGGIYYVAVDVRQATILEKLIPGLREGATLVDVSQVRAPGENEEEHRRAELASMRQSQEYAAAVALRSLGYRIQIVPRGASIESTVKGFPAAGKLCEHVFCLGEAGFYNRAVLQNQPNIVLKTRLRGLGCHAAHECRFVTATA